MYRLISEWDIGEENLIFAEQGSAMTWLLDNPNVHDLAQDNSQEVHDFVRSCFDDGLFSFMRLEIVV